MAQAATENSVADSIGTWREWKLNLITLSDTTNDNKYAELNNIKAELSKYGYKFAKNGKMGRTDNYPQNANGFPLIQALIKQIFIHEYDLSMQSIPYDTAFADETNSNDTDKKQENKENKENKDNNNMDEAKSTSSNSSQNVGIGSLLRSKAKRMARAKPFAKYKLLNANVFVSKNILNMPMSNNNINNNNNNNNNTSINTIVFIIVGTGGVEAGQWSRQVCRNDSLCSGTVIPYIEYFLNNKNWGVIICDPNPKFDFSKMKEIGIINKISDVGKTTDFKYANDFKNYAFQHCVYVFDQFVQPYLKNKNSNSNSTSDDETMDEKQDSNSVENKQKDNSDNSHNRNSGIENILILAHSAGGRRTTNLLAKRGNVLKDYVRGIAFTDIADQQKNTMAAPIAKQLYTTCAKNWVKGYPLDEQVKGKFRIEKVGAGHQDHVYTSATAFTSIIKFFQDAIKP